MESGDGMLDEECEDDLEPPKLMEVEVSTTPSLTRKREWCNSPEWQRLLQISKDRNVDLSRIPEVPLSGIFRHPSGKFWSCKYPTRGWATARWSSSGTGMSEFQCMLKVLRQLIKFHIEACPPHACAWRVQLQHLSKLDG